MQQYVVIKTKLCRSHILVIVYSLPLETILLSAYSKNTITFYCTRCSVWACSRTVSGIFFPKKKPWIAPCVTSMQRDLSHHHSARQFKDTDPLLGGSTQGNKLLYKADSRKQRQAKPFAADLPETEGRSPHSYFCRFCCTNNSPVSLPAISPKQGKYSFLPIPLLHSPVKELLELLPLGGKHNIIAFVNRPESSLGFVITLYNCYQPWQHPFRL